MRQPDFHDFSMTTKDHATQETKNRDAITRAQQSILADYRATFGTDAGKRVLESLKHLTGHGKPAYLPTAGGAIDPYATHVRVGRQSVVDEILANLATAEDSQADTGPGVIK